MKRPKVLITSEQIGERVADLSTRIRADYRDRNPLLIGALKGSFVFMSDLVRSLNMPLEVDFISVASYGGGTETSGVLEVRQALKTPTEGRDILVVEDIVDTGITVNYILETLRLARPVSLRICAMLDKPSRRQTPVHIDYLGFTVPDKFIVGYGLDFAEQYRYLPDICYLDEE